jgi:hypothetical protein
MVVSSAIKYLERNFSFQNIFETISNFKTDQNLALLCLIISFISFGVALIEYVLYSLNNEIHLQLDWNILRNKKNTDKSLVNCVYPANSKDNSIFNYKSINILPKENEELLMKTYEWVSSNIVETSLTIYDLPADSLVWIHEMIEYNIIGGTFGRGLAIISARDIISDKILNEAINNKERVRIYHLYKY